VWFNISAAALMATGLVLDTSDGHLARLQGTSSRYGAWLDGFLDEATDLAIHGAAAWSAAIRFGAPIWLALGVAYASSKFLYHFGAMTWDAGVGVEAGFASRGDRVREVGLRRLFYLAGHADIRWHLWIVLAAVGWMEWSLVYAGYFLIRAVAGIVRKGKAAGDV
jgi:phosphatidylglycerophosphate synthase